jgi:hypothetical protein
MDISSSYLRIVTDGLLFQRSNFAQAAQVAFGLAELGRQEGLDQVPGGGRPHNATAQTNNVHVIILDSLPGREVVEDQTGSHALNLVGADGRTHAAAANSYSAIHLTRRHRLR